ncbi:MAG: PqqD family protein [Actinomycetota bacterium]|nr:PqqD family protein [Actinomycetota bacterium]
MELDAAPRRSGRALAEELNGELVLVHVDTGMYYTLNEVGGRVWALCDGSLTVAQVIAQLCEEFDAPPEEVKADVLDLVGHLTTEKLLVAAP